MWLNGSYKLAPERRRADADARADRSSRCSPRCSAPCNLLRIRAYALAGWIALMLLAWLAVSHWVTTWGERQDADADLAGRRAARVGRGGRAAIACRARAVSLGARGAARARARSAAWSSPTRCSTAPPTSRRPPATKSSPRSNSRFAGRGPDAVHRLRRILDVRAARPRRRRSRLRLPAAGAGRARRAATASRSTSTGSRPSALLAYPLIVTRVDPAASRPPAAYRLLWQGRYYQVWGRRPGAPAALEHVALSGSPAAQCAAIERARAARAAAGSDARLVASRAPDDRAHPPRRARSPRRLGARAPGARDGAPGTLRARFTLPSAGAWDVWVQGDIMPTVRLSVDGRRARVDLRAAQRQLARARHHPRDPRAARRGSAQPVADALERRPRAGRRRRRRCSTRSSSRPPATSLADAARASPASQWRSLCGREYQWVELRGADERDRCAARCIAAPSGREHSLSGVSRPTECSRAIDQILLGENLELLPAFADESFQLVYIDPPFNTGKVQTRRTLQAVRDADGERTGFQGRRYSDAAARRVQLRRRFDDYLAFLAPRLEQAHRLLAREGTLYFHIDYREAHHCKLLLDEIFGRECFLNEIIWAYDYGARTKRRWPAKHDTILVYVKDPARVLLRLRGGRPRALHGARPRHAREGRARQAARPTCGGTRSCPPAGTRRPATRRRSPRASCGAWCRPRRARATGAWTSSPAAARSAPSPRSSAATTC